MKINFEQEFKTLEGVVIKDENDEVLTLKKVSTNSLMASLPREELTGEQKLKRYNLANKIHAGEQEVLVEDISLIKEMIGKVYTTLIVGQAYNLLEKVD